MMRFPFSFAAVDFETTGSVAGYAVEPWQIGVARWDGEAPVLWESWLKVGPRPFHPRAPGRHAQIRGQLERAPALVDLVPEIRRCCGGIPLVAHNAATEQKMFRQDLPLEKFGPWIDTLKLSRSIWPELPSHSLGSLLERFEQSPLLARLVPDRGEHDALYDAAGCGLLLGHILDLPEWRGVSKEVLLRPDLGPYYRR